MDRILLYIFSPSGINVMYRNSPPPPPHLTHPPTHPPTHTLCNSKKRCTLVHPQYNDSYCKKTTDQQMVRPTVRGFTRRQNPCPRMPDTFRIQVVLPKVIGVARNAPGPVFTKGLSQGLGLKLILLSQVSAQKLLRLLS